jgi:formylglycine-generating enzyme required for sulfatase activity
MSNGLTWEADSRRGLKVRSIAFNLAASILILLAAACSRHSQIAKDRAGMVFVPSGVFIMGVNEAEVGDDNPEHQVYIESFWIDIDEVTNARYRRCVDTGACYEPMDLRYYTDSNFANHPVVFVSWYDASRYCAWEGKRLPTEAEWEKAARGTLGWSYPWGNELDRNRLNAGNRVGKTTPVGMYPGGASPYGALDMAGNVWDWVEDWYAAYPGSEFQSDLFGQKYKVVRGGSWNHPDEDARSFHRDIASPTRAISVVGFRCAAYP